MNVIVIMEDSFRKDHLGCYGNKWIKTPHIDKLASESVIFDYAYAEGLPTIPVRTALFTGRYTLPFRRWQPPEQTDILLAEILWDKGITSALIADTYHMHKPQMGFGRGFDYVKWIRGQESDDRSIEGLHETSDDAQNTAEKLDKEDRSRNIGTSDNRMRKSTSTPCAQELSK